MISLNLHEKEPIYKQIMAQIILLASNGLLAVGDQLPSTRELASELGINPNTVARAYNELENRGVIVSVPKKGTYLAELDWQEELLSRAGSDFQELANKYLDLGLTSEELKKIMEELDL